MNRAAELLGFKFRADEFVRLVPKPTENTNAMKILSDIIDKHGDSGPIIPAGEAYRRFMSNAPQDIEILRLAFGSPRQVRKLAFSLSYCESKTPYNVPIVQTPFLSFALQLIDEHFCDNYGMLLGLFNTLLKNWSSSGASRVRAFIKSKISNYDGKRKTLLAIRNNSEWYLDERGPIPLATKMLGEGEKLSDVWEILSLPDYMRGYEYFGMVATQYVNTLLRQGLAVENIEDVIKFLELHNDKKTDKRILSEIITKLGSEASYDYRDALKPYVLNSLGDPALLGYWQSWENASEYEKTTLEEARQIFNGWLTQEFIHLFFEAARDPYRKAFWLAYAKYIGSFKVVGSSYIRYRFLQDERLRDILKGRFAILEGAAEGQVAFIFRIKNYTFVEFGKKGAAFYAYLDTNPLAPKMDKQRYSMSELRHSRMPSLIKKDYIYGRYYHQKEGRYPHFQSERYYWQDNLRRWIEDKLGISPTHSYRIYDR